MRFGITGVKECPSCHRDTCIISGIDVAFGPTECSFTLDELEEYSELLQAVFANLPNDFRRSFDRTKGQNCTSNVCIHCNNPIDESAVRSWYLPNQIQTFSIRITEQWQHAIHGQGHAKSWAYFHQADSSAAS
jgi:hypothetical protein